MKVVIQRVKEGKVKVNGETVGKIEKGIVVLVGFEKGDIPSFLEKMADKIVNLRIFEDSEGKMNLSLKDIKGELLLVPNFTLAADCKKGRRPSFQSSENPEIAKNMFDKFVEICRKQIPVETGIFGAEMEVYILNDGPVTFILDSRELFQGGLS
ncbi:D-aminoacyl-tRNA deacylase [Desulfurobacterium indicum]|uniref:D-aminoacyl-tRNA deacylase n=1 Tax=Desulfurobacterium indicum TaxID=1914305 RepID=A0A1R1MKS0_9BACT|nr:D-aminoacyl-tRNA deacylase [Desulfurobacterium indicum]OMH40359.1 D-tyrosyl-tRNA(Tyr) deacylase [Desulfurobacterium indicum]